MEKQMKNLKESLKKINQWIITSLKGGYINNNFIHDYLMERKKVQEKTLKKLNKFNFNNLITWEEIK